MHEPCYLDVSDRSILGLEGSDGLDLLQRISTNDVSSLKVGEHIRTVLTTEKGRIVDVVVVFRIEPSSLVLAGASTDATGLRNWIERFIVMEDVRTVALSGKRMQMLLFNIQTDRIIAGLDGSNLLIAQLNSKDPRQVLVIGQSTEKTQMVSSLGSKGFTPATADEYNSYCIDNSIPGFPNEFSTQFNPLEVGLDALVSFTKGCYVGQEVIARLDTYDKVKRGLRQLHLSIAPEKLPSDLFAPSNAKAGVLTRYTSSAGPNGEMIGLGVVAAEFEGKDLTYAASGGDLYGRATILPV